MVRAFNTTFVLRFAIRRRWSAPRTGYGLRAWRLRRFGWRGFSEPSADAGDPQSCAPGRGPGTGSHRVAIRRLCRSWQSRISLKGFSTPRAAIATGFCASPTWMQEIIECIGKSLTAFGFRFIIEHIHRDPGKPIDVVRLLGGCGSICDSSTPLIPRSPGSATYRGKRLRVRPASASFRSSVCPVPCDFMTSLLGRRTSLRTAW